MNERQYKSRTTSMKKRISDVAQRKIKRSLDEVSSFVSDNIHKKKGNLDEPSQHMVETFVRHHFSLSSAFKTTLASIYDLSLCGDTAEDNLDKVRQALLSTAETFHNTTHIRHPFHKDQTQDESDK